MKTTFPSAKEITRKWYVVDASGQILGRLASQVARLLMGKHKPNYTPFLDMGDHVIVVNAKKIRLTGRKWEDKIYRHHTGYPGGLVEISARRLFEKNPTRLIELAVSGMLPKNKLRDRMLKRLRVYAGPDHPHEAQKPEAISF